MKFQALATVLTAGLTQVAAVPGNLACSEPETWVAGASFGPAMSISTYSGLSGGNAAECVFDVPQTVNQCEEFTVKLVATEAGHIDNKTIGTKILSTTGADPVCDDTVLAVGTLEKTITLEAPVSGTVKVYGLCGQSGGKLYVADSVDIEVTGNLTTCETATSAPPTSGAELSAVSGLVASAIAASAFALYNN